MIRKILLLILLTGFTAGSVLASSQYERDDSSNLASIKTAVETLDNAISGAGYNITQFAGTAVPTGNGTATAGSPRVTIASDSTGQIALAGGTALIGRASASLETGTIYSATTALTPKFAFANVAASQTDANIVTAVASKKIRVLGFFVSSALTSTVIFNSKPAGAGTAISATITPATGGFESGSFNPVGWFETVAGEGLTVTTGAGGASGIQVVYVEV